jgi:hypothetical protein
MQLPSMSELLELDVTALEQVSGGDDSLGRCGPGSSMKFLGDVRTPECLAHDTAVRDRIAAGDSTVTAHLRSLPLLPAAIGSYLRARGE